MWWWLFSRVFSLFRVEYSRCNRLHSEVEIIHSCFTVLQHDAAWHVWKYYCGWFNLFCSKKNIISNFVFFVVADLGIVLKISCCLHSHSVGANYVDCCESWMFMLFQNVTHILKIAWVGMRKCLASICRPKVVPSCCLRVILGSVTSQCSNRNIWTAVKWYFSILALLLCTIWVDVAFNDSVVVLFMPQYFSGLHPFFLDVFYVFMLFNLSQNIFLVKCFKCIICIFLVIGWSRRQEVFFCLFFLSNSV